MTILTPVGINPAGQLAIAESGDTLASSAVMGTGGTPSVVAGAAAGSGASVSIVGTNISGIITLKTGVSLLTTGVVLTATLANGFAFPNGMVTTFAAGNAAFAGVLTSLYVSSTANTSSLAVTNNPLSVNTTYIGYYHFMGY